jgi:hypothetical protein
MVMDVWGSGYMGNFYLLFNFAVTLKLIYKIKCIYKKNQAGYQREEEKQGNLS